MAKSVDITEKLNFNENPRLIIKGEEYEVNSDALSMLKILSFMDNGNPGGAEILDAYETIFPEGERERLEKEKLKFDDFVTVVKAAVTLVVGEPQGE